MLIYLLVLLCLTTFKLIHVKLCILTQVSYSPRTSSSPASVSTQMSFYDPDALISRQQSLLLWCFHKMLNITYDKKGDKSSTLILMTDGELLFYHLHKKTLARTLNVLVWSFDYCDHIRSVRGMLCRRTVIFCSSN